MSQSIIEKQDLPECIKRLKAQRQLYADAKVWSGLQMILSGPVAVTMTVLSMVLPQFKIWAVAWGLLVLLLDLFVFTPTAQKLRENGARVQELIDTELFRLPWQELKAGKRPELDLINKKARKFGEDPEAVQKLHGWYPAAISELPEPWGSIICQRCNVWWNAELRRHYADRIRVVMWLVAIGVLIAGIYRSMSLPDVLIYSVLPMLPALRLGYQQITEQRSAAERLDKLREHAEKLLAEAGKTTDTATLQQKSRELQDEIFEMRRKNPPTFDFMYWRHRDEHTDLMNRTTEDLVTQVKRALA